jgi:hypothetical protein
MYGARVEGRQYAHESSLDRNEPDCGWRGTYPNFHSYRRRIAHTDSYIFWSDRDGYLHAHWNSNATDLHTHGNNNANVSYTDRDGYSHTDWNSNAADIHTDRNSHADSYIIHADRDGYLHTHAHCVANTYLYSCNFSNPNRASNCR